MRVTQPFARDLRGGWWRRPTRSRSWCAGASSGPPGSRRRRAAPRGRGPDTRSPSGTSPMALDPVVEGALGGDARLGHPDLLQPPPSLRLAGLREVVGDVDGLVHPATLRRVCGHTSDSADQKPGAPSPTASLAGRVKPRCFMFNSTSRQLCVDCRTPFSMTRKCLSPRAFTPISTNTHRRPSSPRNTLWMPSAQGYTHSSLRGRRHYCPYSSSHTRLSRPTTFAESPRAASSPTSAAPAWRLRPVDTPRRYSHGTAASTLAPRRTQGRHQRGPERLQRPRPAARLRHPDVRQLLPVERPQERLELRRHRRFDQPPSASAQKLGEGIGNLRWRRQRNHIVATQAVCSSCRNLNLQTQFQRRHAARLNSPAHHFRP